MVNRREMGPDAVELEVSGDLNGSTLPDFRAALYGELDVNTHHVGVDLGEVRTISSAAIGTILLFQKRASERECTISITRISPELLKIFSAIRIESIVRIEGTSAS